MSLSTFLALRRLSSAPSLRSGGGSSVAYGWGLVPFGGYGYGYGCALNPTMLIPNASFLGLYLPARIEVLSITRSRSCKSACFTRQHARRYPGAYGGGGGGGFGNILLYGILAVFVVSALQGLLNRGETDDYGVQLRENSKPSPDARCPWPAVAHAPADCFMSFATTWLGAAVSISSQS
jgi:hypothetical protein